jgi:tetratricopeptide (TPR) repeat protein
MTGISRDSACIVTLLFICGGTIVSASGSIAAGGKVGSSSEAVSDDASRRDRDGMGGVIQGVANIGPDAEFQAARDLFHRGDLAGAEEPLNRLAKDRRGTTRGERCQYYLAECQYRQKKFVDALDSFERLHVHYPATEYLPKLVGREYELARLWLAQSEPRAPVGEKSPGIAPLVGRLRIIDTRGLALKALEHIRQHEPYGPLADDAAILIADYSMKCGDFESASLYYDEFIAEFHKSEFLPYARFAAVKARIKGGLKPHKLIHSGQSAQEIAEPMRRALH